MDFMLYDLFFVFIWFIEIAFNFFVFYVIIKVIVDAVKQKKTTRYFTTNVVIYNSKHKKDYVDVPKRQLDKFHIDDINTLKDYFYDIFYRFETAYNSLDYNTMKELATKQVYENYHTGISLNSKHGKKRVIDNIVKKRLILYELDSTSRKQIASLMVEVSYITYTLDKRGYVISGNKNFPITERFEVCFRKEFDSKPITHCPNCGANLKSDECEYCKSKIKDAEFQISSIKKIID